MTTQLDLDLWQPARELVGLPATVPQYMCANLIKVRDTAARKPFKGGKKFEVDRGQLLAVLSEPTEFVYIALAFSEHRYDDVFRSLLRLRREGAAVYLGDDVWEASK